MPAPAPFPAPNLLVAEQLAPSGHGVEKWVAGPVTDERREQLVLVARETAPDSEGRRTLLVFDWGDGEWRRRLSAPALLPCASCVSVPDQREVSVGLRLSDERPATIDVWFDHGWAGHVSITIEYFPDYGFMVKDVHQSGWSQGLSHSLPITDWSRSVYPIEGRIYSSSVTSTLSRHSQGETFYGERPIMPRWIDAETADYRRLLDLFSEDPTRQPLPLNPARSLDGY